MAGIKDVAKLAGVSVGTVSKYLNTPQGLKEDTRRKVEDAIEKLQYKPNPLARSMRTGRTDTIAVIVPDIGNPFFAEVYNAIRLASVSKGYTPILYTTEDDPDALKTCLESISIHKIDGMILCFVEEDEIIEEYIKNVRSNIPIVLFSRDISNIRSNCIVIDVFEGVGKSTGHLISLGHKNIAYVGGDEKNKVSRQKFSGYLKALRDAGLKTGHVCHGNFDLRTGYFAARELLMLPEVPTAIVAESDIIAIGCMKYLLQKGVKIPDDMAVIGFDNIDLSSMYEPSLSTISLPIRNMGEEALKLLLESMNNTSAKSRLIVMNSELIIRNSTDKSIPVQFYL